MSMDPSRWVNTIPFIGAKSNQEKYKLDSNKWVNTLPSKDDNTLVLKDDNTLILSNAINSNPKPSSGKKYYLTIIVFIVSLILVSVIKNETRNLQKEISNLQASINTLKLDLHQTTLEHEVITSPENISRLAMEYLESDFVSYKKSQIRQLKEKVKTLAQLEETKDTNTYKKKSTLKTDEIKLQVVKKIETTKTELRKLQELYSSPEKLPGEIKLKVAKKIETKKDELQQLYSDPYSIFKSQKTLRWAGFQIVKVFLGIPIVPGK
ncbi:MAG TPA: hypothetical protein EYN36_02710 [Pelagibacteraceae bacterium]|nr:hypothetical protein [Pelagibacteraceae bacterium]